MGRLKISTITMAMMLMVATVFAGIIHASRLAMGEATEPMGAVYADLVTCGVGVVAEGMLMFGASKRMENVVLLWVLSAPMRAIIHVTVAIFMLLPELTFPSIVLAIYLFILAAFLIGCARHACNFRAFLRSGRVEVDDNPTRAEALAAAKAQRHWLGFDALAAYPAAFLATHAPTVATARLAHVRVSKRAPSLLKWDSEHGKGSEELSPGSATPPLPERTFGFTTSSEESSPASTSNSASTSTSTSSTAIAYAQEADMESPPPSVHAFRSPTKMMSIGALKKTGIVIPAIHKIVQLHHRHQHHHKSSRASASPKKSPKKSSPERSRPSVHREMERRVSQRHPGSASSRLRRSPHPSPRPSPQPSPRPSPKSSTPMASPQPSTTPSPTLPTAKTTRKRPAPEPEVPGTRKGRAAAGVASNTTRTRRLGAGGGPGSNRGDAEYHEANIRAPQLRHRPDLLAAAVAAAMLNEGLVDTKLSFS